MLDAPSKSLSAQAHVRTHKQHEQVPARLSTTTSRYHIFRVLNNFVHTLQFGESLTHSLKVHRRTRILKATRLHSASVKAAVLRRLRHEQLEQHGDQHSNPDEPHPPRADPAFVRVRGP